MEYDNRRHNPQFNKVLQKEKVIHFKCKEARGTGWLSMNGLHIKNKQVRDIIVKLSNLSHLYVSGCTMKGTIPSFETLPKLQVLDLSDNSFDSFTPHGFKQNTDLIILDISMNRIARFPSGLCHTKSLKELNLAQNDLVALPEDIDSYEKLAILDVSYNLLRTIPDSVCTGRISSSLKVLRLKNNVIAKLSEQIGKLTSLEELDLRENDLSSLPLSAKNLKNLQVFHHVGNQWTLPSTLGKYGYRNELLESSYGSQALKSLCELLEVALPKVAHQIDSPEKSSDTSDSNSLHIESLC